MCVCVCVRVVLCSYGQAYPTHVIHLCLCAHAWLLLPIVYAGNQGLTAGYQHHTEIHWSRSWSAQIPRPSVSTVQSLTLCSLSWKAMKQSSVQGWLYTPLPPLAPLRVRARQSQFHISAQQITYRDYWSPSLFLFSITLVSDLTWPESEPYTCRREHEGTQCVSEETKHQ